MREFDTHYLLHPIFQVLFSADKLGLLKLNWMIAICSIDSRLNFLIILCLVTLHPSQIFCPLYPYYIALHQNMLIFQKAFMSFTHLAINS